jgi:hypothetical protein
MAVFKILENAVLLPDESSFENSPNIHVRGLSTRRTRMTDAKTCSRSSLLYVVPMHARTSISSYHRSQRHHDD